MDKQDVPVKSLKFKNKNVFGDTFDAYKTKANGHVMEMLLDKRIDETGRVTSGSLSELWSYIYILYLSNIHYDVFDEMRGRRGKLMKRATAKRFVKTVLKYTQKDEINVKTLKFFINDVIKRKNPVNPILSFVSETKISLSKKDDKLIRELVKLSDVTNSSKLVEKIKYYKSTIEYVKSALKKEIGPTSKDDIKDVIAAVQKHIQMMKKPKEPKQPKELKQPLPPKDNTKDALNKKCTKKVDDILQIYILSKMCLLKYIAAIISEQFKTQVNCEDKDIIKQQETYYKLPAETQDYYRGIYKHNYKSLLVYKRYLENIAECNQEVIDKIRELPKLLTNIHNELTNIYEDLFGSVRVFIKIRKFIPALDNIDDAKMVQLKTYENKKISLECNGEYAFKSAEFFGCFDDTFSNLDIYTGKSKDAFQVSDIDVKLTKEITDVNSYALYKTFKQLEHGYSICMSGFGVSGSGKSAVLLGYNNTPGLVHYGLKNLKGVKRIELHQAFELYYNVVNPNQLTLHGKIIVMYDESKSFQQQLQRYGVDKSNITYENVVFNKTSVIDTRDINDFLKNITSSCQRNMKANDRIKQTPLNNTSSRSHLFLIFKIEFENGSTGFFTLSDQAGMEDAYVIYSKIFTKKNTLPYFLNQFDNKGLFRGEMKHVAIRDIINVEEFGITNGNDLLTKGSEGKLVFKVKPIIEDTIAKNVQILYESFYIVESLLGLRYFFNRRNSINASFNSQQIVHGSLDYRTNRVFKQPALEDVFNKTTAKENAKVTSLMVPVLNYIDNLSKNKGKLTKFVMFVNLRQDKCAENKEALMFASNISGIVKEKKE